MKVAEMVDILDHHHQFVPTISQTVQVDVPNQCEKESLKVDSFHTILFHGDQLTVERMRSAQSIRANSEDGTQQLKGFLPVVADWHTKVSFLGVSTF